MGEGNDRITYVGHATLLLDLGGVRILTDPVLRDRVAHLRRQQPLPRPYGLTDPDLVLVSHADYDHLDRPSLRQVARACPVVTPRRCRRLLAPFGVRRVSEISPGESIEHAGREIVAVPAVHGGRRHPLSRRYPAQGYLIRGEPSVYFAGDTDLFEGMRKLRGEVDVALLPVAGWGPRVGPGHLDEERAARAVEMIRPRTVIPIHWGTFAVSLYRIPDLGSPPRRFAELVAQRVPEVEVTVLQPGESAEL